MKKSFRLQMIAAVIVSTMGLSAFAQDRNAGTSSGKSATGSIQSADQPMQSRDLRASKLIGTNVRNAEGERLGNIQNLMVDPAAQRVHYAVLSFGGFLGMGDKLFAFPVNLFKPGKDPEQVVLNIEKDRLRNAPGFDRNNWPDMGDNRYRGDVDRYYQSEPAKRGAFVDQMMRASDLIGRKVKDGEGNNAGEIEDLVVSLTNGQVRYVVVDLDKAWSQDEKMVALPLRALTFPRDKGRDLVLNVPKERIDTSRGFEAENWPDLNNAEYRRQQDNYLSTFDTGRGMTLKAESAERQTLSGASGTDQPAASGSSGAASANPSAR